MSREVTLLSHPDGCSIEIRVVPRASRTEIVGPHDGALRIRVAAPPEGGKANKAAARLLQEAFGARDVYLDRGGGSRSKRFVIVGLSPAAVRRKLDQ